MNSESTHQDSGEFEIVYIYLFVLCIFSLGSIYRAYMIYNFGEYQEGVVLKKEKKIYHGVGSSTVDYYIEINVLEEKLHEVEREVYTQYEEGDQIDFFIFNNDTCYLLPTDTRDKSLKKIINESLSWYHKLFLFSFIIFGIFSVLKLYSGIFNEVLKTNFGAPRDNNWIEASLLSITQTTILFIGIGVSYYLGWSIFNAVVAIGNFNIVLVGFLILLLLIGVFIIPMIIHHLYLLYQSESHKIISYFKKGVVLFTVLNILFAFFGSLANSDTEEFSLLNMWLYLKENWKILLDL